MKKLFCAGSVCFVLTLCLLLALGLTGCNGRVVETVYLATPGNAQQWASNGNAWATGGNAADGNATSVGVVVGVDEPLPTTTPVAVEVTPTPASEESLATPEPTPLPGFVKATQEPLVYSEAGEYNGLSAILTAVSTHHSLYDLRQDGVLSAKYAAQLLDWYMESGEETVAVVKGVAGWLERYGVIPEKMASFMENEQMFAKLDALYHMAVSLWGQEGEALLEQGSYVPATYPYEMQNIEGVFTALYAALGEHKPQYVRQYDGAECVSVLTADSGGAITPETIGKVLVNAHVLAYDVSVLHREEKDGTLVLDFSDSFLTQLKELDAQQEERLIRSVVNTMGANLGRDTILLTVKGEPLKTANKTYSEPLTID